MSYSNTVTKTDLKNIIEQVSAIDGTDMTQAEIEAFVEGLDVSGINAVDYIVEQGTSGIWTYRKWNSGIAECWGRTGIVVPTSGVYSTPFPFTFNNISHSSVNIFYGYPTESQRNAGKYIVTDGNNNGSGDILEKVVVYVRDYNGNVVNPSIAFDFYTHGTWK